jgi:hypothetical protein
VFLHQFYEPSGGFVCSQTRVDDLHEEVSTTDGNVTACMDAYQSQVRPTIISAIKIKTVGYYYRRMQWVVI